MVSEASKAKSLGSLGTGCGASGICGAHGPFIAGVTGAGRLTGFTRVVTRPGAGSSKRA
jgi:hypothetical protein